MLISAKNKEEKFSEHVRDIELASSKSTPYDDSCPAVPSYWNFEIALSKGFRATGEVLSCQFQGTWYAILATCWYLCRFAPARYCPTLRNPRQCPCLGREIDSCWSESFPRMLHRTRKFRLSVLLAQTRSPWCRSAGLQVSPRRPLREGCVNSCKGQRTKIREQRLVDNWSQMPLAAISMLGISAALDLDDPLPRAAV